MSRRSESTAWDDHLGHRLTAEPSRAAAGRPAGVCILCAQCGVPLAFRAEPLEAATEGPDPAFPLPPLVDEVIAFAAGLRAMLLDAGRPDPPPAPLRLADGSVVHLPPLDADPYWRGYRDATRSGQQALLGAIFQRLEDTAAHHVPVPDRGAAWRLVRAAVLARLRRLRPAPAAPTGCDAASPTRSGASGLSDPPFFAKSGT